MDKDPKKLWSHWNKETKQVSNDEGNNCFELYIFFLNFHQVIYSLPTISCPSLKLLAVMVFEVSSFIQIRKGMDVEIVNFSTCPGTTKKPKCTCP